MQTPPGTSRARKALIGGGLLLIGALFIAPFFGVYENREFATRHLFLKHRPCLTFRFRAPLGESDRRLQDLSPEDRRDEELFHEFVEAGGGDRRSLWLFC